MLVDWLRRLKSKWSIILTPLWWCALARRDKVTIGEALRVTRRARRRCRTAPERFRKHRSSDTLAVLGSGPSINDVPQEEFAYLRRTCDTFGLNFWCYHDFVPDFYSLEGFPDRRAARIWLDRIGDQADAYRTTLFLANAVGLYRSPVGSIADFTVSFPPSLRERLHFYTTRPLFADSNGSFSDATLRQFRSLDSPCGPYGTFRGSVSLALQFGYGMGYRNVVLYGVDLNTAGYFWTEDSSMDELHTRTNYGRDEKERHATADENGGVGIQHFIWHLREEVFQPEGREVCVADERSLLHPRLPLWPNSFKEKKNQ